MPIDPNPPKKSYLDRGTQIPEILSVGTKIFINIEGIYFVGNNLTQVPNTYANSEGFFCLGSTNTVHNSSGFFIDGDPVITGVPAGGDNTQVQFNDNGMFAGSGGLTFDKDSNTLFIGDQTQANQFSANDFTGNTGHFQNVAANNFAGNNVAVVNVTSNQVFVNTVSGNTVKASVSVNVGANVYLSPVEMFVGDGSANTVQNSSGFYHDGALLTSTPPGGSSGQVQFNDGGVFAGSDGFTFDKTSNNVTVANTLTSLDIQANQVFVNSITGNIGTGFLSLTSNQVFVNSVTGNIATGFLSITSNEIFVNALAGNNINLGATGTLFIGDGTSNIAINSTSIYFDGSPAEFGLTVDGLFDLVDESVTTLDTGEIVLDVHNGANLFHQRTMAGHNEVLQNPNNMPMGSTISVLVDPTQVSTDARSAVANATGEVTSNATQHPITLPAYSNGQLLLVFFTSDGSITVTVNTTASGADWNLLDTRSAGSGGSNQVTAALLYKYAQTASEALTLTTSGSEQSTHISLAIDAYLGGDVSSNGVTNNNSTNVNPPNVVPSFGTQNYLYIVSAHINSNIVPSVAPTNYGSLLTNQATNTNGASTSIATRQVSASSSEDPGTFTSSANGWVSYTVAVGATGYFLLSYDDQYLDPKPTISSESLLQIQKIGASRYVAMKSWEAPQ